jgi:hypothetical protein
MAKTVRSEQIRLFFTPEQIEFQLPPRHGRSGVAGGDEPLELESVEVGCEMLEEIGFVGIVAVA